MTNPSGQGFPGQSGLSFCWRCDALRRASAAELCSAEPKIMGICQIWPMQLILTGRWSQSGVQNPCLLEKNIEFNVEDLTSGQNRQNDSRFQPLQNPFPFRPNNSSTLQYTKNCQPQIPCKNVFFLSWVVFVFYLLRIMHAHTFLHTYAHNIYIYMYT